MLGIKSLVTFALLTPLALSAPSSLSKRAVSQAVLDDLVLYTKYASALELTTGSCPKPLNSTLVVQVSFMLYVMKLFLILHYILVRKQPYADTRLNYS